MRISTTAKWMNLPCVSGTLKALRFNLKAKIKLILHKSGRCRRRPKSSGRRSTDYKTVKLFIRNVLKGRRSHSNRFLICRKPFKSCPRNWILSDKKMANYLTWFKNYRKREIQRGGRWLIPSHIVTCLLKFSRRTENCNKRLKGLKNQYRTQINLPRTPSNHTATAPLWEYRNRM